MISFIEGTVEYVSSSKVIISAQGVGYAITVLPKILAIIANQEGPVKLFLFSKMNVREGITDFYGFTNPKDLELFKILTSVSGLGPKTAMQVLSSVEPRHLKEAVVREDPQALRAISGLGLKTAQRLVVELQDKLTYLDVGTTDVGSLDQDAQALEALVSLGYQTSQAKDALKHIKGTETLQDRVRQALQLLSKK